MKIVNFLIKHTGTIPVDRRAGAGAYAVAVERLRAGELVAVYPEATISRSFELKEFKTGAARMAVEAQVPIIPLIVWGAHRRWTKDHPRKLGRAKIPITVKVGDTAAARRDRRAYRRRDARVDDDAAARRPAVLRASRRGVLGAAADGRLGADDGRGEGARRERAGRARPQASGATGRSDTARADRERRGRHAARRRRDDQPAHPQRRARGGGRGHPVRAGDRPPAAVGRNPSSTRSGSRRWRCARTVR